MPDYLDSLSEFAASLQFASLSRELREQAHWVAADTLAAIAGGSAEPEMRAFASSYAHDQGSASVIGTGAATAPDRAALLNGCAGTFLEMDEGNRFAKGHPAIHVFPAALAYAEQHRLSGSELMSALVVGYEVGARIGIAASMRPSMHPHGTWGTVGAAAAVARLARFDAARMREAINVASSLTLASSKRTMLEGGLVRNVYAGVSNQMGLMACALVEAGFSGERDGLASVFGSVVSERFDRTKITEGLGSKWQIARNYFKLHSCCRYNHGALDALDRLDAREGLPAPERVRRVRVTSYAAAAELDDPNPKNTLAAKFSIPFAIATRLVNRSSALASFTLEAVRNPVIQALARRVVVAEDASMTARLPLERPARVEIELDDGTILAAEAGINRGDDADPYSREELAGKFLELTQRAWPEAAARRIHALLLQLGELPSLDALGAELAGAKDPLHGRSVPKSGGFSRN